MTIDELKAIPFYFVCSAVWEDEHTLTYESEDGRLGYCDHTPRRKNGEFGRTRRHWQIDGKVYRTKRAFVEALKDYNPNIVSVNHRPYQNTVAREKHKKDAIPPATIIDITKHDMN